MKIKFSAKVMGFTMGLSEGYIIQPNIFEDSLIVNINVYLDVLKSVEMPWRNHVDTGRPWIMKKRLNRFHQECGVSNDLGHAFKQQAGGREGYFDNAVFPWHARIEHRYKQQTLCNGVILTNDRILTTANCQGYYHKYGINVYAGVGTNNYADGFQDGIVKSFVAHQGYNITTGEHNIAIIALHERLV
ncbi:unnamed protein product [Lepeophtheirus salmonis]|uniref:(salmon louse) hypothetical protein n=1 Tax=Lepeophtheirus salmonis TaxID=72036 RepID=A0A7R8D5M8_LEPSM|nr:unnamed protein product [Lepeophtheirus salmonis]CAF3037093.1 unnamed protein product [Lepeophtheirus salmonis]